MLLMEDVDSYEIMPWPDRIFLPGYQTGGETPAPEDYRIMILSVTQALQEVPKGGSSSVLNGSVGMPRWGIPDVRLEWDAPVGGRVIPVSEGVGVAVADTLMWQRHKGPWLQGMYGHGMLLDIFMRVHLTPIQTQMN